MADTVPLSPRLREVLGIEVPILQSGMGGVAGTELAAAVCNAGGLGVLAALGLGPDQTRAAIRELRSLADKPFGVNIWLHDDVRRPPDPEAVPDDVIQGSQAVLNDYRPQLDLPTILARPEPLPDLVNAALEVMIDERVPVFSSAIGVPERELVDRFHAVGSNVVAMAATTADASEAVRNGVDVVVAQGTEAGGHRSFGTKRSRTDAVGLSTLILVSEVIAAIDGAVPVVAAGGIIDGRGLAAMLALGADGVLLGSRFVATKESLASPLYKTHITTGDRATTLTDGFTGQWARVLASEFTERWEASGVTPPPGLLHAAAGRDLFSEAKRVGDERLQPLYVGAGVGALRDIPAAGDVVRDMLTEARAALGRWS